jgi:hypothetical protein
MELANVCINSFLCGLGATLGARVANDAYTSCTGLCRGNHAHSPRAVPDPRREHGESAGRKGARANAAAATDPN